ncbi:MAG: hypothetical protein MUC97_01950 [Bernardetiaceae bacterium]|nr:hypothetical protein [Bernardetiaceae bacterium]
MKRLFTWAALLGLAALGACTSSQIEPLEGLDFGRDYFPLARGRYVAYNVRETSYQLNRPPQITTYQVKEVLTETFTGAAGEQLWRLVRYRRANGRQNWQVVGNSALRADERFGIRLDDNQPYVRLNFPLQRGQTWDGNLFNNRGRELYQLTDLNRAYRFDGRSYTETATVLQSNDSSLVDKDKRLEVYARNIGLIYRLQDQVAYCQDRTQNCFGRAVIESGTVVEQSIYEHGVEQF